MYYSLSFDCFRFCIIVLLFTQFIDLARAKSEVPGIIPLIYSNKNKIV